MALEFQDLMWVCDSLYLKMENEKIALYYMLLEETNQIKPSKVQFGKFVKVLEVIFR